MRNFVRVLAAAAIAAVLPVAAQAKVHITVDLDSQTMHVESKDRSFDWKVSSGKAGYETPPGKYRVLWMDKDHHSDEYEQAPMPNAIFFAPGFAIHGFGRSPWGHAASHGCIRLPTAKAEILFDLVKAEGAEIEIDGDAPSAAAVARRSGPPGTDDAYAGTYADEQQGRGEGYGYPTRSYGAPSPGYTTYPLYGQVY